MLSKRNFAMMMMMIVVLVLFLSSPVLKEYFNDYDVNHAAETELIDRKEQKSHENGTGDGSQSTVSAGQEVLYIGTRDNGYHDAMKEWAGYRKKKLSGICLHGGSRGSTSGGRYAECVSSAGW